MALEALGLEPKNPNGTELSDAVSIDRAKLDLMGVNLARDTGTRYFELARGIVNAGRSALLITNDWDALNSNLAEGNPFIAWGTTTNAWKSQFPNWWGNGEINHVIAILGRTSAGKYIIGDPSYNSKTTVEMTQSQLATFNGGLGGYALRPR